MGYLQESFKNMDSGFGKLFHKNECYADVYEQWLTPFIGKDAIVVEIGTGRGGSLQVWKHFLGPKAKIYGIDHKGELFYTEDQIIANYIADQRDIESLRNVPIPELDIFVDDASHENQPQINTFEVFFPRMRKGGVYIVEDVGTSYRVHEYGGGYRKPGTFMEYCKDMADWLQINEWGELIPTSPPLREATKHIIPNNSLFNSVESVSFYMGMIIIRKR
jgi:hypothetical protein